MTGKGDTWGRDRLGRSAPAFLSANTTALPPPTCTARGRTTLWQLLFRCEAGQLWAVCFLRPVPGGESAGCVRLQCLFCGLCACRVHPLPAIPTALLNSLPPFILLCPVQSFALFAPCSCHVRQDRQKSSIMFASCKTVLLAAATRACSGGPCAGSIC